ncbi:MAG: WYL domain-containing protein [Clostridiaceae bacterium]|nr:WYL domain-containing protein [Clostridiaceae bacterium]
MAKSANQKLKLYRLSRILEEQTDEEHPMTIGDMIRHLAQHGIEAERKSLYDDIEMIRTQGMDICTRKTGTFGYYVGRRPFELPELKLLVDAVQCSRFITRKKSMELIRKLEALTSRHLASQLQREVYLSNRVKTFNESIYYNVDRLHAAIAAGHKASFRYYEYTIDKHERFRRNGEVYVVNPCALTWDNENYYLIAFDQPGEKYYHYRVDRMAGVEVLGTVRDDVPASPEFELSRYVRTHFAMFTGEEETVEIEFDNALVGVVIDRFGKEIPLSRSGPDRFCIHTRVAVSAPFLSWVFQFGANARIVGPASVVAKMQSLIAAASGSKPKTAE